MQCDEDKPVCRRCARNGRTCYGHRQPFSVLHEENIYASRHQKRPQGPRVKGSSATSLLSTPPSRDLISESVAYFIHCHLDPTTNTPLLVGIPAKIILSNWNSSPVLELAASSIALLLFSRTKLYPPATRVAFASYQESLATLRATLSVPGCIHIDACLLAVCLLARYEDAVFSFDQNKGIPLKESMQIQKHHIGAIALLEYWVKCLAGTSAPTASITYARRALRKAALFGLIDLPDWLRDGALFGEEGFMRDLDRILIRAIDVRSQLKLFAEGQAGWQLRGPETMSTLRAIQREIRAIDIALSECKSLDADTSRCIQHALADHRVYSKKHFFHSRVYSFSNYAEAARCAHCHGYQILVNHLHISTLRLLETFSPFQPRHPLVECQHMIDYLTEELMLVIPFGLDRFKVSEDPGLFGDQIIINSDDDRRPYLAELMAIPLLIASTSDSVRMEYADWFRSQLADTGRLLGYGAVESATSSSWPIQKY
ncbi:uncharacterized protein N7459_000255 [Penicillium hispanicum]|uniref:uncharacterized protein n=1 Tax=Penicillium hispanicum TaxID=1080232 RepID=UPI002540A57F|nr:uncharacterized protein N7459_000255 [Penicillium hispanicum]KAJ5594047.1 hypothetical protein N7459_000255 [Penicillium hispanicum]